MADTFAKVHVELPAHDWLYYRIHVTGPAGMQDLLERVVRPALARLRDEVPELRWFFLQFMDVSGLHLRLRLNARQASLVHVEGTLQDLLSSVPHRGATQHVYAPETRKFGSGEGMRLAERVFEHGSEAALACLGPRQRSLRTGYAAAHMTLMLAALEPRLRRTFLHQYAWYWSGGPLLRGRLPHGASLADAPARSARLLAQVEWVLSDPGARSALTGYAEAYRRELSSPARTHIHRTDTFLLFHHIHLMNNRLGVVPSEEAQLARFLWLAGDAFSDAAPTA
ncbi:Thiopeptide-type bacteriocin biosynthesis domain containing protein [Actinobacteria bacterium OV450]|nr:Thiopeptide-type bacteriocin biosynthesis domain containing protein [Actinobacteria bacterium OV450]